MNKILKLLDENFVLEFFKKEVLPKYPSYVSVSKVEIKPYKKLIWETTYHVVINFDTHFLDSQGQEEIVSIVCSAHSNEMRATIHDVLEYLWEKNFPDDEFELPRPLFYSEEFNGAFYGGLKGENLLYYIKKKDKPEIEKIVRESAQLFSKLHNLKVGSEANFNPHNARIKTVVPGVKVILQEVESRFKGLYTKDLKKVYDYMIEQEELFFASGQPLSLIHGDAHPENIIKTHEDKIGLIDFTDMCLSDFARDLGSFTQQLDYKIITKAGDFEYAEEMKKLFIVSYLKAAGIELNADLEKRIKLYYNFTAIRTATFFFLKDGYDEERGKILIKKAKEDLNLI